MNKKLDEQIREIAFQKSYEIGDLDAMKGYLRYEVLKGIDGDYLERLNAISIEQEIPFDELVDEIILNNRRNQSIKPIKYGSNCCHAEYAVAGDIEGTSWYECHSCGKPCDVVEIGKKTD